MRGPCRQRAAVNEIVVKASVPDLRPGPIYVPAGGGGARKKKKKKVRASLRSLPWPYGGRHTDSAGLRSGTEAFTNFVHRRSLAAWPPHERSRSGRNGHTLGPTLKATDIGDLVSFLNAPCPPEVISWRAAVKLARTGRLAGKMKFAEATAAASYSADPGLRVIAQTDANDGDEQPTGLKWCHPVLRNYSLRSTLQRMRKVPNNIGVEFIVSLRLS